MDISVIIPNYNGEEILEKGIPAVLSVLSKYHRGEKEVIIIDDASKDNSIEKITSLFKSHNDRSIKATLIRNKKNLGFAPTVNKGVRKASGEVLILLNTDVVPEINFLEPLR